MTSPYTSFLYQWKSVRLLLSVPEPAGQPPDITGLAADAYGVWVYARACRTESCEAVGIAVVSFSLCLYPPSVDFKHPIA